MSLKSSTKPSVFIYCMFSLKADKIYDLGNSFKCVEGWYGGGSTELNIFFLYVNNNASCEFIKKNILSVECGV